jgi:hypothetical protein
MLYITEQDILYRMMIIVIKHGFSPMRQAPHSLNRLVLEMDPIKMGANAFLTKNTAVTYRK